MRKTYFFKVLAFSIVVFACTSSKAQCTATTVPYYEGFQSITTNNQLPACWAASNLSTACLTYTGSVNYAAFSYTPNIVSYFYSRGISLIAGVTYSAALLYKTDNSGSVGWSDLSIMRGSTQSSTGLVSIASTGGPANGPVFAVLSNTFVVSTSGTYYVAVRGTAAPTSPSPQPLNWDDLSITYVCGPGSVSSPTVKAAASPYTVCSGGIVNLSAIGADIYSWSNGSNVPNTFANPTVNPSTYTVWGVNSLSGCVGVATVSITVLPLPTLSANATPTIACAGQQVSLTASGGSSYAWSNGHVGSPIVVSAGSNNSYTVIGTSFAGCSNSISITISMYPSPTLTASASRYTICEGEKVVLNCGGASTHTWTYSGGVFPGSSLTVNPNTNTTFTASGTSTDGCVGETAVSIAVAKCDGIELVSSEEILRFFPNPNKGMLTIESRNSGILILLDLSGREWMRVPVNSGTQTITFPELSSGFYYLSLQSGEKTQVLKIVKE